MQVFLGSLNTLHLGQFLFLRAVKELCDELFVAVYGFDAGFKWMMWAILGLLRLSDSLEPHSLVVFSFFFSVRVYISSFPRVKKAKIFELI